MHIVVGTALATVWLMMKLRSVCAVFAVAVGGLGCTLTVDLDRLKGRADEEGTSAGGAPVGPVRTEVWRSQGGGGGTGPSQEGTGGVGGVDPCGPPDPLVLHDSAGNTCYRLVLHSTSWNSAELDCQAWNGNLASIVSSAEHGRVAELLGPLSQQHDVVALWIGAYYAPLLGEFAWSSGEAMSFTAWGPNEPSGIEQLCVRADASSDWAWFTATCEGHRPHVCERPARQR